RQGSLGAGTAVGGERGPWDRAFSAPGARGQLEPSASPKTHFAAIAAKNPEHGSLNPRAQFRERLTVEEVLAAPLIVEPLTRPMCSPIGDGAAAVVVMSERRARACGITRPVPGLAGVLHSGWGHGGDEPGTGELCV